MDTAKRRQEYESAIKITGPVELTLGPQGGFREVTVGLVYDGQEQKVTICDQRLWLQCLEPLTIKAGLEIATVRLPPKSRIKRTT